MKRKPIPYVTLLTRKNRVLGTEVTLEFWADEESNRWQTICSAHSTLCGHDTKALALSHMAAPWGWCEDCRALLEAKEGRRES